MADSLLEVIRQEAIEALCDTDGMKWSDATDLVERLIDAVAVAPCSGCGGEQ